MSQPLVTLAGCSSAFPKFAVDELTIFQCLPSAVFAICCHQASGVNGCKFETRLSASNRADVSGDLMKCNRVKSISWTKPTHHGLMHITVLRDCLNVQSDLQVMHRLKIIAFRCFQVSAHAETGQNTSAFQRQRLLTHSRLGNEVGWSFWTGSLFFISSKSNPPPSRFATTKPEKNRRLLPKQVVRQLIGGVKEHKKNQ